MVLQLHIIACDSSNMFTGSITNSLIYNIKI